MRYKANINTINLALTDYMTMNKILVDVNISSKKGNFIMAFNIIKEFCTKID